MNILTFKNLVIQKFRGRYKLLNGFKTPGTKQKIDNRVVGK